MRIIDQFKQSREKKEEQTTPPPKGHTLAEILHDKNMSHLFGRMLETEGQEELAVRLMSGKLESEDIELLEEERKKFSEKITLSEKTEELLTEENVVEIARNHPDFAKIVNLIGPKKAIKAIRSQLKEICITDEYRFNQIAGPIEAYDSHKKVEYREINDKVEAACKGMGISNQEYLDAIAIQNPQEKKAALKKLIKGKYKKSQTVTNFLTRKTSKNLKTLKDSEVLLGESAVKLDEYRRDLGDMLFHSVSDNDDMRDALARELLSENTPAAEPGDGFGEAKKDAGDFDEKKFDKDWEAFKSKMNYDSSTDFEKGWVQGMFIDEQKETYRKKSSKRKGFWASVMSTLFEGKINSKRDTLK